jgi:putative nucleotidyltransferase with HDIG domain
MAPSLAAPPIPEPVRGLLERLWAGGHAAYVVGGSLRDVLLGRQPADWDLATDARPDRMLKLFPGAAYDNRFGTVAVRVDAELYEITTFRSEHEYADFRRPHRVEFGDSIELDLRRRDFTVNAMAWGADAPAVPTETAATGRVIARLVDPFGGTDDVAARLIRAVGEPAARFEEDALRMIRAVRLAAVLDFSIEGATFEAIVSRSDLAAHLSGERIAGELGRLLTAPKPSMGLDLLARSGLLSVILPELAAQQGIPQNKIEGEDLWAHTMRSVDAAPADRPVVRLAALLHDVGKPETQADGHFVGHDAAGAEIAAAILARLRTPRALSERVVHLVRNHMFSYEDGWSDAAVRRFIARVGRDALAELLALREADDAGSGRSGDPGLARLRERVDEQLAAEVALDRADLAIDGDDLISELGMSPGPGLGRVLDELLDRVVADPELNDRPTLLLLARTMLGDE